MVPWYYILNCIHHTSTVYSNFRKYATPPDEKRCIIMENSFLSSLGIFVGACFAQLFSLWEFTDVQEKMAF